jgi:hypothetical protein
MIWWFNYLIIALLVVILALVVYLLIVWTQPSEYYADLTIPSEDEEVWTEPASIILPKGWPEPVHTFDPTRRRGEHTTCAALEEIYNKPFKKGYVFDNPLTGRKLELDCYNPELKIAAEYNGVQHYKYPNPFHESEEEFIKQVQKDDYKVRRCDQLGIYLIRVPYKVPYEIIPNYVEYYTPEAVKKRKMIEELNS